MDLQGEIAEGGAMAVEQRGDGAAELEVATTMVIAFADHSVD